MTTVATASSHPTAFTSEPVARQRSSVLRDIGLVYSRAIRLSLRNPVWLVMGLAQPLLYLFFYGPLLTRIPLTAGSGASNQWQVFVPAIMVMLGLFGTAFAGFGLISEWRDGVIDRMRVTPMSRFALLAGRVLRDLVVLLTQAVLLVLASLAIGLRAPVGGIVVGIGIVTVMGAMMSAVSYAVALTLKSEDALAPLLNGVMLPVMLLSGIMLPITSSTAPAWLYWVSRCNPMAYVVDGARAAFLGHFGTHQFWIGLAVAAALAIAGLGLSTRAFTRQAS